MSEVQQFKIILLGDASVGKSSIIHRYIMSKFKEYAEATLGTAFFCKVVFREEHSFKLNVLRNADHRYGTQLVRKNSGLSQATTTRVFFRPNPDADAAILVFDLTNLNSLSGVEYYLKEVSNIASEDIVINVVGNKKDMVTGKGSSEYEMQYLVKVDFKTDRRK